MRNTKVVHYRKHTENEIYELFYKIKEDLKYLMMINGCMIVLLVLIVLYLIAE